MDIREGRVIIHRGLKKGGKHNLISIIYENGTEQDTPTNQGDEHAIYMNMSSIHRGIYVE